MQATKGKQQAQRAAQDQQVAAGKAQTAKHGLGIKALLDGSFISYLLGRKPAPAEKEVEGPADVKSAADKATQKTSANPDAVTESVKNAEYKAVEGERFVAGEGEEHAISPDDVRQGSLGNCYLVAALAAVAKTDRDIIKNMVADHGDGTYTITFHLKDGKVGVFSGNETVQIRVTNEFPMRNGKPAFAKAGDEGAKGPELWVMLIEKAWAIHQGSYEKSRGSKAEMDSDVMQYITGGKSTTLYCSSTSEDRLLKAMVAANDGGHPMTASMPAKKNASEDLIKAAEAVGLHFNHAYTVMSVDKAGSSIELRNPWGSHHPSKMKISDIKKIFRRIKINAA